MPVWAKTYLDSPGLLRLLTAGVTETTHSSSAAGLHRCHRHSRGSRCRPAMRGCSRRLHSGTVRAHTSLPRQRSLESQC